MKLEISDVQKIDKGFYKLVAKNEKGEATSQTVEVTDLPPEEKPKGEKPKLSKLTNVTTEEGKTVDFITSLKVTDTTVIISWYRNETTIKSSSEISITFDGTTAHLSITKCKITHAGTYKVIAKNEFGEDETIAILTVTEKKEKKQEEEEEEIEETKEVRVCMKYNSLN